MLTIKNISALLISAACTLAHAQGITARAYIIADQHGNVLIEKNADQLRSIASITKLLVAIPASSQNQDELLEVTIDDIRAGYMSSSPLKAGSFYTRRMLMELALSSSDNVAAITLGRNLPEGTELPVNEFAGLDPDNQLSARQIATVAMGLKETDLASMSLVPSITVEGRTRNNTNPLINQPGWNFYLSKTGYIRKSGGCLVVVMEMSGQPVTAVLLGSRDTRQRWRDLATLRRKLGDSDFYQPKWNRPAVKRKKPRYKYRSLAIRTSQIPASLFFRTV